MDTFNHLQMFVLVAEQGSFAAVAKKLGADPSTISKAILNLEQRLGLQLFQRTTRKINITAEGREYLLHVKSMLDDLNACEQRLKHHTSSPSGSLKINAPVSYGRSYLLPLVPEFCKRYPDIKLDIHFDDAYVDIIEHGYDVLIRTGTLQEKRIVARPLSSMDFVTCAAPDYLKSQGVKRLKSSMLANYSWIRFRFKQSGKLMPILSLENGQLIQHDVNQDYLVDDGEAMAELCAAGLGLSQFPHFIARSYIEEKKIVPVYKSFKHPTMGVHVMYAKREHLPERVRVFVDFLKEKIESLGETTEGTWALKLKPIST
ncbi:LysR family transcriptional regulator [Agaribacterium sp. ZY112]|uniref:LysR family transcriptional regulator n=1 Tax=Agaribacterium sp. ZY112 TaxID=3233574 RepID=UPI003526AAC6